MKESQYDVFVLWKDFSNHWLAGCSQAMDKVVNSKIFAQSLGRLASGYSKVMGPLHYYIEESTQNVLHRVNVPTRDEITRLASRLTNVETRIDDIHAKLEKILEKLEEKEK